MQHRDATQLCCVYAWVQPGAAVPIPGQRQLSTAVPTVSRVPGGRARSAGPGRCVNAFFTPRYFAVLHSDEKGSEHLLLAGTVPLLPSRGAGRTLRAHRVRLGHASLSDGVPCPWRRLLAPRDCLGCHHRDVPPHGLGHTLTPPRPRASGARVMDSRQRQRRTGAVGGASGPDGGQPARNSLDNTAAAAARRPGAAAVPDNPRGCAGDEARRARGREQGRRASRCSTGTGTGAGIGSGNGPMAARGGCLCSSRGRRGLLLSRRREPGLPAGPQSNGVIGWRAWGAWAGPGRGWARLRGPTRVPVGA